MKLRKSHISKTTQCQAKISINEKKYEFPEIHIKNKNKVTINLLIVIWKKHNKLLFLKK